MQRALWATQNSYWSMLKVCFPRKCFLSCSAMACLKMFLIVSNMQSGWNKVGSPTDLLGFCSNTSRATFHWVGNTPLFKAELKTASNIPGLVQHTMVHTLLGIPHGPGAFLTLLQTRSTATLFLLPSAVVVLPQLPRLWPPVLRAAWTADS